MPLQESHNQLIEPPEKGGLEGAVCKTTGKVLISDTALCSFLPPQLRRMSERHKQMCGCETCVISASMQQSLNAFHSRLSKQVAD